MDLSGKSYDRIRAAGRRGRRADRGGAAGAGGGAGGAGADTSVLGRQCAHPGCKAEADYRAPKGRGKEGQYHWFCLDHVREYNKSYNYFQGMTDDDVIAYQRDAVTGHRPTSPIGVRDRHARAARSAWSGVIDDPFDLFAKGEPPAEPQARRISGPERHAFEVLGLPETASKEAVKARYKTLVKRHHPDANQGDRSSEDRLRSVISAYNVLRRRGGHC